MISKYSIIPIVYLLFLSSFCYAQSKKDSLYDTEFLDINNMQILFNNTGGLDFRRTGEAGRWERIGLFNTGSDYYFDERIIFDHGLWFLGKNNGKQVFHYYWWGRTNYSPGPIINGKSAVEYDLIGKEKCRVYKITRGEKSNIDIRDWPSEFGAPVNKDNLPLLYNDQTIWAIFNTCDTSNNNQHFYDEPIVPANLEIKQMAYGYEGDINSNMLSDVVFLEWTIINKGTSKIDSAYIGLWCDLDMIFPSFNPPAVDTLRQLGYCWTNIPDSWDDEYQKVCPAVGYTLLYGPRVKSTGDTAIFNGREIYNFKNLPVSSFFGITSSYNLDSFSIPNKIENAWNLARGFNNWGECILDSVTNQYTKFTFSGDPVTNSGWNWNYSTEGEASFYMFTGPFTFEPADTQWVMYAITAGLDTNKLASITKLRRNVDIIRSLNYDELVKIKPINYENSSIPPDYFYLSQNYPNPFNPTTKIRYELPIQSYVNLSVYDILGRKVSELVNKEQNAGYYEVEIDGSKFASGVYFYRWIRDFIQKR